MLDLKFIIKNEKLVKEKLLSRNFDIAKIKELLELASQRSNIMTQLQELEARKNKASKEIGKAKANGKDIKSILNKVSLIKKEIEDIKHVEKEVNDKVKAILLYIPNIPSNNTPIGKDEKDNKILKEFLSNKKPSHKVVPHYEIATKLDIVDFDRAVKMAGTRFWIYKGLGAKLVRALENFMLDQHINNGYVELKTPLMVSSKIMEGTGQLPKFADDLFKIEGKDAWLIPTAEVTLTNYYSNEIIDLKSPIKLTAFTPCFRAEAGSGGKDMKGLIRAHQFNKVELVKITNEKTAYKEYLKTIEDARIILELLELSHQTLQLVTGDIGFSSSETVDLEVWLPSEEKYREVSSISYFNDYQGRRAAIRYYDENGKIQIAHTINGSGLAIDRIVAAILENCQNQDGTINVPKVLIPYMGVNKIK